MAVVANMIDQRPDWMKHLSLAALINLYRGEGGVGGGAIGGDWFTSNKNRAASFLGHGGKVLKVDVPDEVFEAGRTAARQAGSGTRGDAILPLEWVRKAVPTDIGRKILDLGGDVGKGLGSIAGLPIPMNLIRQRIDQQMPQG